VKIPSQYTPNDELITFRTDLLWVTFLL
jgi:hypothetical protein